MLRRGRPCEPPAPRRHTVWFTSTLITFSNDADVCESIRVM
jgi:hypothetical protein